MELEAEAHRPAAVADPGRQVGGRQGLPGGRERDDVAAVQIALPRRTRAPSRNPAGPRARTSARRAGDRRSRFSGRLACSMPLPGALTSTILTTRGSTRSSGTWPPVSSSTVRPASRSRSIRGYTPSCSRGSPPVTSTRSVPRARTRRGRLVDRHLGAAVEGVGRVAPDATQRAAGQPDERARQSGARRLSLDRLEDLRDAEGRRHGAATRIPPGPSRMGGQKGGIGEPVEEDQEERHGRPVPEADREDQRDQEVGGQDHLAGQRKAAGRAVLLGPPFARRPLDPVLGRPREFRRTAEGALQDGPGVVDGHADAERQQKRQAPKRRAPATPDLALRRDVERQEREGRPKNSGKSRTIRRCQPMRSRMTMAGNEQESQQHDQDVRDVGRQVKERLRTSPCRAGGCAGSRAGSCGRSGSSPSSSGAAGS